MSDFEIIMDIIYLLASGPGSLGCVEKINAFCFFIRINQNVF